MYCDVLCCIVYWYLHPYRPQSHVTHIACMHNIYASHDHDACSMQLLYMGLALADLEAWNFAGTSSVSYQYQSYYQCILRRVSYQSQYVIASNSRVVIGVSTIKQVQVQIKQYLFHSEGLAYLVLVMNKPSSYSCILGSNDILCICYGILCYAICCAVSVSVGCDNRRNVTISTFF